MRKVLSWVVLVIILALLSGCTFGWETYSNKVIQFSYPGSWEIGDPKELVGQFPFEFVVYDSKKDPRTNISLMVQQVPLFAPSAKDQADMVIGLFEFLGPALGISDLQRISFTPMKLGNIDAGLATVEMTTSQNGGMVVREQLLIVPYGSRTYTLTMASVKDKWEAYDPTFKKVIASFKLMGANISSVEETPNQNFVSLVNAGNSFFDQGNFEQAIENYERALKIKPDDPNVLVDLGTSYFYQKNSNPDKAVEMYNQALQIAPNFRNALYNKGVILKEGKKDLKGAIAIWKQFLKYYPSGEQADNVRRWLNEVQ